MYRQKQRITLTAAAVVLVPFAAACGTEKADGGSSAVGDGGRPVTGVHWSVDSVTVDGRTHRAPEGAHVRIDEGGRAEGSFGCNSFSAKAEVTGDRVRISDATSTEKGCTDMPMKFEETLSRTLTAGPLTTGADGDRLTLTTADGDTVRLSEQPDAALYGTKWTVTTPAGRDGQATADTQDGKDAAADRDAADGKAGEAPHLTFDEKKGTVSGSLGCNRVNADATVRDGHITLGPAATTRMVCEGSLMDTEKRLLKLFDSKVEYRIDQQTLTLTSANGTSVRAVADR